MKPCLARRGIALQCQLVWASLVLDLASSSLSTSTVYTGGSKQSTSSAAVEPRGSGAGIVEHLPLLGVYCSDIQFLDSSFNGRSQFSEPLNQASPLSDTDDQPGQLWETVRDL